MNNFKLKRVLILVVITIFTLQSCEKKDLFENENMKFNDDNNKSSNINTESIYILNKTLINENDIDFNNENLTIVYGYGKEKYVFYSDKDMYKWASSKKGLEKFAQSIKNVEIARNFAIKTGEIDKKEPSKEFEKYLNDNFNTGEKSGGIMYQYPYFGGWSNYMFPFPKARLKSKYDNDLSSFKCYVNSYRLYDKKWWRGSSVAYLTVGYCEWETVGEYIDNKTSSYWAF